MLKFPSTIFGLPNFSVITANIINLYNLLNRIFKFDFILSKFRFTSNATILALLKLLIKHVVISSKPPDRATIRSNVRWKTQITAVLVNKLPVFLFGNAHFIEMADVFI